MYKAILSYCLKGRKNTESKDPWVVKTKNGRTIDVQFAAVKQLTFIKEQAAKGLLSKTDKIPLLGPFLI